MNTTSHRILSKYAHLLSAHWLREVCQALFFIYLARQSTGSYGEFMLAMGMGGILLLCAEFGFNQSLVAFLSREGTNPGEALVQVSIIKGSLLICTWLGMVGFVYWQNYAPSLRMLVLVIGGGIGMEALASTFLVVLRVQGRQDLESRIRYFSTILAFGYGLLTLWWGCAPLIIALYKPIESLTNLVGAWVIVWARDHYHLRWSGYRKVWGMAKNGLIFALLDITSIIYNKINLLFLQQAAGSQGVAQYSATWQMVDGISSLVSGILMRSVLFPILARLWQTDRRAVPQFSQKTFGWLMAAALPLMFVLYQESDRLINLIYGSGYQDAVWLQKYLVITVLFAFIHNLAAYLMMSMGRERLLLIFYLVGLTFNLAWCILAIPAFPLLGAALAVILTKGGVAVMSVSYCQRCFGIIPWWPFIQLAAAAITGLLLYYLGLAHLPRIMADALSLVPFLGLGWHWRRLESRQG